MGYGARGMEAGSGMTLADELRRKTRLLGRVRGRVIRPLGAWEIYEPDPEIRREEIRRIHRKVDNRRRREKAAS